MDNSDDIVSYFLNIIKYFFYIYLKKDLTFDHYKNDECVIQYKQTADLDSGSAHNEGPPKIQKPTQSIKLPENPLLRVLYNLHAPQIQSPYFFSEVPKWNSTALP